VGGSRIGEREARADAHALGTFTSSGTGASSALA
jgi:hypothetical protein